MQFLASKKFNIFADIIRTDVNFRTIKEVPFSVSMYGDSGIMLYLTEHIQTYLASLSRAIINGSLKPNMHTSAGSTLALKGIDNFKNGSYSEQKSNIESVIEFNACDLSIVSTLDTNDDTGIKLPKLLSFNVNDAPLSYASSNNPLELYIVKQYNMILGEYWYLHEKPLNDENDLQFLYIMCFPKSINITLKKNATAPKVITRYSSTASYAVGDECYYNFRFYICKTPVSSEEFTPAHWTLII